MRVELPELKRCCCCIPLRYGLIGWGYIKLILCLVFSGLSLSVIVRIVQLTQKYPEYKEMFIEDIVLLTMILLISLTDICLTIVFLVGGYRKNAKLLRIYYIFNMVELGLFTVLFLWGTAAMLYQVAHYMERITHGFATFIAVLQWKLIVGLSLFGTQLYVILLIRSEMIKLRNSANYSFTNPTQSAQEDGTTY